MGQKVHPIGFRLGVIKGWESRWYAERDYKDMFAEDDLIRRTIKKDLANASVSRIEIERAAANQVSVTIHTAKPGIVIGKSGEKVDKLRATLEATTKKRVRLNILEIRQPELDAYLVARSIAEQLEKRVSFRRAMKQAAQKSMRANAKGIRIIIGGRLGGTDIARSEREVEGKIPLHTLRADIDYGLAEAHTTFGVIGIKVWIYKGDILPSKRREAGEAAQDLAVQQAINPRERDGGERRGERRRTSERGGRGQGERAQSGDRGTRQAGGRTQRPQGERSTRGQGERAQSGDRGTRQAGERPPRQPRTQGERSTRGQGERPPRQRSEQQAQAEETPVVQTSVEPAEEAQVVQSKAEETPAVPPAPETADTGETQSE